MHDIYASELVLQSVGVILDANYLDAACFELARSHSRFRQSNSPWTHSGSIMMERIGDGSLSRPSHAKRVAYDSEL
jgi:hypothetical protein